jgi:hypothetical protein
LALNAQKARQSESNHSGIPHRKWNMVSMQKMLLMLAPLVSHEALACLQHHAQMVCNTYAIGQLQLGWLETCSRAACSRLLRSQPATAA